MDRSALLPHFLRPMAGGIHVVSTGSEAMSALQGQLYGCAPGDVQQAFAQRLAALPDADVVALGVPSDVGAGFARGASFGPSAIRKELLPMPPAWLDIGDVFVVPQLLHDEMLGDAQREVTQDALYTDVTLSTRRGLPVSPLSILDEVLDTVLRDHPKHRPFVLGGDHSIAWPVVDVLARRHKEPFNILHLDAHTDLLPHRLGVRYCFATWAYHASKRLGPGARLVQVGIRASRYPRSHWEGTLGVKQHWAHECGSAGAVERILDDLRQGGVQTVYISHDIDATDSAFAPSTGTPEPRGLHPDFVCDLIERVGREMRVIGADFVELAPPLGPNEAATQSSVTLAARYVRTMCRAMGIAG